MDRVITIPQAAKQLCIHPDTMRRWIKEGYCDVFYKHYDKGHYRVGISDFEKWVENSKEQA